ncbi:FAD-binding oxidoreductase [Micromonospora parathelypteridis]|uniref:NAD(P)H-flavin reductase n=1 Tax=Micromonospora parathelypteridis TaxID=1839617 RepID=A0A840VTK1_9ACTN|nr:FAD-binding oxidoreductase [Micromonospora parathelypteridis]MBB5479306.1 NAD(P)H-flavin reductase [Micromonospora parathelypteridis]GGO01953.1 oxidoreductase [Micromonospora parathelypteridis]
MSTLNDDDPARVNLAAAWASVDVRAAGDFWCTLEDRRPGLLPQRDAPLFFTALGQLMVGGDDPASRAALLLVLGRAYRHFDLLPHASTIGDTLLATVARHAPHPLWATAAERAICRATRAVRRVAAQVGDGPAWWHVQVIDHDRPSPDTAILTVRPWRRLPYQPGQAVPVCTPRLPGHWRWLSPANAPRADGTVELHVRAVPAGTVSHRLVHEVRPGELLWLGPPGNAGLSLDLARADDLLLVAGGTGLAPLRALVEQVAAAPDGRRVTLVVGARNFTDLYDAIALDKLQRDHDWLTIVPAFSGDPFAESAEQGDALTIALDHHQPDQEIYLCGPPAMLADARPRLLALGIPAERIHLPDSFTC